MAFFMRGGQRSNKTFEWLDRAYQHTRNQFALDQERAIISETSEPTLANKAFLAR